MSSFYAKAFSRKAVFAVSHETASNLATTFSPERTRYPTQSPVHFGRGAARLSFPPYGAENHELPDRVFRVVSFVPQPPFAVVCKSWRRNERDSEVALLSRRHDREPKLVFRVTRETATALADIGRGAVDSGPNSCHPRVFCGKQRYRQLHLIRGRLLTPARAVCRRPVERQAMSQSCPTRCTRRFAG